MERVPVGLENFQVQHSDPIGATSALTCVSSALDLGGPRGLRSPSRLRLRSTAEDEQWEHAEGENRDPMRPHRIAVGVERQTWTDIRLAQPTVLEGF